MQATDLPGDSEPAQHTLPFFYRRAAAWFGETGAFPSPYSAL